jgi:hypothetical protein
MLKNAIFVLAICGSLFHVNSTWADVASDRKACSDVDLATELGPVRNQGNIGWCYANVAADLITFRFKKELNGRRASAGYVALIFNEFTSNKPNDDAGLVSAAALFSQWYGVCPASFEEPAFAKSPFKTLRERINSLVLLKEAYDRRNQSFYYAEHLKQLIENYRNSKSMINQLSDEELEEILQNSSTRSFPRKLADRLCGPYKIKVTKDLKIRYVHYYASGLTQLLNNPNLEAVPSMGRTNLIQKINQLLDHKNVAAIGYRTSIFYDPKTERFKKAGMHASSIVGRRWNAKTNTCDLKLRNSWGQSCDNYTNPELKDSCDPKTGYLYLPPKILARTLDEVIYYQRP